jgi:hypothetical protein
MSDRAFTAFSAVVVIGLVSWVFVVALVSWAVEQW